MSLPFINDTSAQDWEVLPLATVAWDHTAIDGAGDPPRLSKLLQGQVGGFLVARYCPGVDLNQVGVGPSQGWNREKIDLAMDIHQRAGARTVQEKSSRKSQRPNK